MAEKTLFSFQSPQTRLQVVVTNDNHIYVIKNRKRLRLDYPYMEKWPLSLRVMRTFNEHVNTEVLNDLVDYMHKDFKSKK